MAGSGTLAAVTRKSPAEHFWSQLFAKSTDDVMKKLPPCGLVGQLKTNPTVDGENPSTSQPIAGEQPLCMKMPKVSAAFAVDAPHSGRESIEPGLKTGLFAAPVRSKTSPFHVTVKFENAGAAGS